MARTHCLIFDLRFDVVEVIYANTIPTTKHGCGLLEEFVCNRNNAYGKFKQLLKFNENSKARYTIRLNKNLGNIVMIVHLTYPTYDTDLSVHA